MMRMLATLLIALLVPGAGPAAAQEMAAARPFAMVTEPTLRLGDVFDGTGPRAALPVGASPAPGRRLVLEMPQLSALARAHGLVWRPLSPHERVVLERPGQPVPPEDIEAALRDDLLRLGMEPTAELDFGAMLPTMVPPDAPNQLTTEGTSFDPASGRFTATLVVMAEGMATMRQRLGGRAARTLPAVVATRRLPMGTIIGPGDLQGVTLRAERVRPGTAEHADQVVGQQLRRPIAAGQAFLAADLAAPALVEKNALVTMVLEAPGLSVSAQGRALGAAPRGGLVEVMNLASRAVVEAQVIGPGRVRVAIGATPVRR
jgi:flagella basal body P-ring formation protein FlgA